jgi:hypothetical protein
MAAGVLNEDELRSSSWGSWEGVWFRDRFRIPWRKSRTGITRATSSLRRCWWRESSGGPFGETLAIEDFNDNNGADVAVGGSFAKSGAIFIFPGVPTSPPAFTEENACTKVGGIPVRPCEENEAEDKFGSASATGDFNRDGFADMALGAPGKAPGGGPTSGAVFIFPGSASGNGITTGFFITQTQAGTVNEEGDQFGTAVAAATSTATGLWTGRGCSR